MTGDRDFYLDDLEVGAAREETSHPRFRELAPGPWMYETDNYISPFGIDGGLDALIALTEWVAAGGQPADAHLVLTQLFVEYGIDLPADLADYTDEQMQEALGIGALPELGTASSIRVAMTLGQLKICGELSPSMFDEASFGLRCQRVENALGTIRTPELADHHDEMREKLGLLQEMLVAAKPTTT